MAKFIFKRYYKCSNGEIDDENIWVTASDKLDALSKVKSEYPNSIEFILLKSEQYNTHIN